MNSLESNLHSTAGNLINYYSLHSYCLCLEISNIFDN